MPEAPSALPPSDLKAAADAAAPATRAADPTAGPGADYPSLIGALAAVHNRLDGLLREALPDEDWRERFDELCEQCRALARHEPDALLYLHMQFAQRSLDPYSSRHALFCACVADLCARPLALDETETLALVRAALTMNVAMTELQDELVHRERTPTLDQRRIIDRHPQQSAAWLRGGGIDDALWLEIVEQHHREAPAGIAFAALEPAQRLAALLHRIDVFTAKLSARKTRPALLATVAARDACLGPDGRPDEIGAALLRVLGLYPPGSFVRLASGEIGVVTRRGARANAPRVVALTALAPRSARDAQSREPPAREPQPRDTADPAYAVKACVMLPDPRAALDHAALLALG